VCVCVCVCVACVYVGTGVEHFLPHVIRTHT